jgi:DNA-binding CsgD family transcriptional regulator
MDIAYTVTGAGFPFLKMPSALSGIISREHTVLRGWTWACDDRFLLVEYDGRGQNHSTCGIQSFTMDDALADLEAVVQATRVRSFVMWATALCWPSALRYAAEHPEQVAALALFDPEPSRPENADKTDQLVSEHFDQFARLVALAKLGAAANDEENRTGLSVNRDDYLVMHRGYRMHDPDRWLPGVRAPVLLLETRSVFTDVDEKNRIAASLPVTRHMVLPGKNLSPIGDNLGPAFAALDAFLADFAPQALNGGAAATADRGLVATLTPREREVLALVAAGHRNAEIAESLVLSPGTVARHVANIYEKLGVHNRAQATAYQLAGLTEGRLSREST